MIQCGIITSHVPIHTVGQGVFACVLMAEQFLMAKFAKLLGRFRVLTSVLKSSYSAWTIVYLLTYRPRRLLWHLLLTRLPACWRGENHLQRRPQTAERKKEKSSVVEEERSGPVYEKVRPQTGKIRQEPEEYSGGDENDSDAENDETM